MVFMAGLPAPLIGDIGDIAAIVPNQNLAVLRAFRTMTGVLHQQSTPSFGVMRRLPVRTTMPRRGRHAHQAHDD
jgi:hypothetical protein